VRLAKALYDEGAYGFEMGTTPGKVFKELSKLSDVEVFFKCASEGTNGLEGIFDVSAPPASAAARGGGGSGGPSTSSTLPRFPSIPAPPPGAAIAPINLTSSPSLRGKELLRAAARALPLWAWACSAKTDALRTLLPALLREGHKVLVFSQLKEMLTILEVCLGSWGIQFLRLDGDTKVEARQELLDQFTRSPHVGVFLLSTKAGGLGLNLTAADTVVIHDSDWNPHADSQAVDRAHRMGQTRPVQVYRMLTQGTMDEHIARLAAGKMELDKALKGSGGSNGTGGFLSPPQKSGRAGAKALTKKQQQDMLAALLKTVN
jgi:hypothetical protein